MNLIRTIPQIIAFIARNWRKIIKVIYIAVDIIIIINKMVKPTAQMFVKRYIKTKIKTSLRRNFVFALSNSGIIMLLLVIVYITGNSLTARLVTSIVLMFIMLVKIDILLSRTIPDLRRALKRLRGLQGYLLKHALRLSILDIVIDSRITALFIAVLVAIGVRWGLLGGFSIVEPWIELISSSR